MVMMTEAWITSSLDKIRGILLGLFPIMTRRCIYICGWLLQTVM